MSSIGLGFVKYALFAISSVSSRLEAKLNAQSTKETQHKKKKKRRNTPLKTTPVPKHDTSTGTNTGTNTETDTRPMGTAKKTNDNIISTHLPQRPNKF
jgi:hypothetical protein